jgi:two-component system nitrogen regulation sensor histidine kinase NtrY
MKKGLRRLLPVVFAMAVFGLFLPLELRYLRTSRFPESLIYLLLFNLNLTALGVLAYFVAKGFMELRQGLRRRVLGIRFQAKILSLFVFLTVIPAALVYIVASGLAGNYLDALFSEQFRRPIETGSMLARSVYEREKERALRDAEELAQNPLNIISYGDYKVYRLETLPADAMPSVRGAFKEGKGHAEAISAQGGDIISAAVPHPAGGVLVVNTTLPAGMTAYVEDITRAREGFVKLEGGKSPLRANFFLILGFVALTIMFTALLAALRLAKGITGPVGELARATKEVARGNLDLEVKARGADEMGLLVESFNRMVRDLRENKLSLEKAYMDSDRRRLVTEAILESIQSGVIFVSPEGGVHTINPAACRILGINAGEVLGKPYEAVLEGIHSEEFKKHVRKINIRTPKCVEEDFWMGLSGRKVLARVFICPLRDSKGSHMGVLVVFDELTELARAQKALAWQEVARRIAHEVKNPLTPIKLSTERMMKKWAEGHGDFAQVFERSTKTIIHEVDSLRRLVDEFSRFGKMPEIRKTPSDIALLAEEVRNLYRPYKDFRLEVHAPPDMPLVELDPEQFKRALINLIDNAREAMGNAGAVSVKIEPDAEANRVFVKVADTGPGIPGEARDKLFLPYFSTKKHGTGLGLAIVQKIVSEHDGYIKADDNTPHGSVFTIELPIKEL